MRLSVKSSRAGAIALYAFILFACKSTPPAVVHEQTAAPVETPVLAQAPTPDETPVQAVIPEKEDEKEEDRYTRLAFGEELNKLVNAGDYEKAIALFDTVPEPDASDLSILRLKLAILISSGKMDEAKVLGDRLEAAHPADPDILYTQAVLAGARKDLAGKARYLKLVLQKNPKHAEAMSALGLDSLAAKNYTQAKSWLVKSLAANPNNTEALLGLARTYYLQDDLPRALDTLNLALAKEPSYSVLWAERARVRSELNEMIGAIEDIQKATELDADVYSHWIDYGTYLIAGGKWEEARTAFGEAIRVDPDQYLAYIYRAGLNDDLGDVDAAISDYSAVCRLYPRYFYASEGLGILLWRKGEYEKSAEAFLNALTYSPTNYSYALMYTLCRYREGKDQMAKAFMAKYITTLERGSTEYFLCRLFVDKSGEADVLNRIQKVEKLNIRSKMLFYSAMYYDLFLSETIAQKYFVEVVSVPTPNFFEYRLSKWALADKENKAGGNAQQDAGSPRS